MPYCAEVNADVYPDGTMYIVLVRENASDPPTESCDPGRAVILSTEEWQALKASPLLWTAEDGFILSAAVIGVWASAVAIRALIRALNVADTPASSE